MKWGRMRDRAHWRQECALGSETGDYISASRTRVENLLETVAFAVDFLSPEVDDVSECQGHRVTH